MNHQQSWFKASYTFFINKTCPQAICIYNYIYKYMRAIFAYIYVSLISFTVKLRENNKISLLMQKCPSVCVVSNKIKYLLQGLKTPILFKQNNCFSPNQNDLYNRNFIHISPLFCLLLLSQWDIQKEKVQNHCLQPPPSTQMLS